ncbi:hypothetical protein, partial [Marinobacter subterrani]|uniref:hypothetical protein n=1 Tax=Marinobacter subterrani TaxID=1658765 RepID=UPI0023573884
DGEALARVGLHPFAIDIGTITQKRGMTHNRIHLSPLNSELSVAQQVAFNHIPYKHRVFIGEQSG